MVATARNPVTKKRSKRKVKATKEPPIRERRRSTSGSIATRGGAKSKAGTMKEDKRMSRADEADEKNLRKDHDKATVELEASRTDRPSRKSTRRGANRMKPDSQLKRRQTRKVRSPQSRHAMRGG
jgi:hypothetical protein